MKTKKSFITTRCGVTVYYSGDSIDQEINNILSESLQMKKTILWLFDLDGTLIESGLETEKKPEILEDWARKNPESIRSFKYQIKKLKEKTGMLFGICTGRGLDFTRRVNTNIFPEGTLGESIIEGGIFIYNPATGGKRYAKCVDKKSAALLFKYRERIMAKIKFINGFCEAGKELAISFNPPEGMEIRFFKQAILTLIESLENEIYEEIGEKIDLKGNLEITASSNAVDLTPKGALKLEALEEISAEKIVGYFGDAENDIPAMGKSRINAVPANSEEHIKDIVRTVNIGLIASHETIEGVHQILRLIRASYMAYQRKYQDL